MKPIQQTIVNVDLSHNTVMVESAKGNRYPAKINRLNKTINVGDEALVTRSLSGEWILVDVEPKVKYQPLDITEFPRLTSGDLNHIQYGQYRKINNSLSSMAEKRAFDAHLRQKFKMEAGL